MTELCMSPMTLHWVASFLDAEVTYWGNTVAIQAYNLNATYEWLPLRGFFCPVTEMV